mgnify:CR=1 FL=1
MTKRSIVLMLVFILSITAITGCNNSNGKDTITDTITENNTITIKVAHVLAPDHPVQKGLEKFAEVLNEDTNGRVKVDIYDSGVLGGEAEALNQVIAGSLDSSVITTMSIWQGYNPEAGIEDLPFLFKDSEMAHKALDGDYGKLAAERIIEPTGVKVVNIWENGFRHFTNNTRPIIEPDDMRGIKFRSAEVPIRIEMFNELGASAIPMAFPEVFTGLQQGTIDGQENPLSIIETSKFYEVQEYLTLSGHIYSSAPFVFNSKIWEGYPDNIKNAIQKAADEARDYERQLISENDEKLVDELTKGGMKVNEVNKEAFIDAVQPVWDNYVQDFGSELVEAAVKYAE